MLVTLKREEEKKDVPLVLFTCKDKLKQGGTKYCERKTNTNVTQIFTLTIMVILVVKTVTSTDRHLNTKMRSSKQN